MHYVLEYANFLGDMNKTERSCSICEMYAEKMKERLGTLIRFAANQLRPHPLSFVRHTKLSPA
jgi:hypothetical protein